MKNNREENNPKNNGVSRRNFISTTMLAGAGIAASSMLLGTTNNQADAQTKSSKPTNSANKDFRKLGSLEVSPIGLGCMSMVAGFYNPAPPKDEMIRHIRRAVERGVTFFDTAEVYGPFTSEEIVGEALEPFKGKVVIASKFGFGFDGNRVTGRNSRPENIRKATEGSLKRLRVEAIDLYYQHRADPNVPVEEVAGTVKDLIQEGKIKYFGLSEMNPETIRKAHAVQKVAAVQSEYSLLERAVENGVISTCEELGIGFVPWGPTARAYLANQFNAFSRFAPEDRRASVPFFKPEAIKANQPLIALVREWALRKNITPVQFALSWLLSQKPFIVPIPGTIDPYHLKENIDAANVKFTADELKEIRASLSGIKLQGVRTWESALTNQ